MKTLLLIEDNDSIRENTAEILELAGYNLLTAPNGKIGVEVALEKKPNLIILRQRSILSTPTSINRIQEPT